MILFIIIIYIIIIIIIDSISKVIDYLISCNATFNVLEMMYIIANDPIQYLSAVKLAKAQFESMTFSSFYSLYIFIVIINN